RRRLLERLSALNLDREKWSLMALSIPEDKDTSSFTSVARDPDVLYKSTKSDVEKRIIRLIDDDSGASLQSKAASKLYLTANIFRDWKSDRRSSKIGKAGAGLQNVLCTIADFFQSFSGIAEMIKAADQQYGGLAYGTVSLLLSVAVHKQQREEAIAEALEELAYAFPRLDMLQKVRPKDSLRTLIVEVFALVISFCRETIDYFAQKLRRLKNAFSPNVLKMKTVSRLRTKLSEIHKECEVMMLEELTDTKKQLRDVQAQLRQIELTGNDTNDHVREGRAWMQKAKSQADECYLSELKHLLHLKRPEDLPSLDTVAHYKSILNKAFLDHRKKQRTPRRMSWDLLEGERTFSNWLRQQESGMLLLGGSNWLDDSSIQLNWLSYASALVVELTAKPGFVLSFFCQKDYTLPHRKRRYFSDVIRSLIYQLAKHHPDCLRLQRQDIAAALDSPKWQEKDSGVAFETMAQLMVNLAAVFSQGTEITIVIDRLDQCRWSDDSNKEVNELDKVVGSLLDFVRHPSLTHLRVKVLLVMDENAARKIAKAMRWEKGHSLDWRVDWDQEEEEDSIE
ncbi:MAG: hypothetical protein Q9165_008928, partial [Trypethelium subeluteriae]